MRPFNEWSLTLQDSFVLYLIYYPEHLKYIDVGAGEREALLPRPSSKDRITSVEWRLSVISAWIVGFHLYVSFLLSCCSHNGFPLSLFTAITTVYLLTIPSSPDNSLPQRVSAWATFLGITAAVLAAIQYAPQLLHTYRSRLVGALSIPMMMIQTPGGFLMVTSIALRPGTNWTSTLQIYFLYFIPSDFLFVGRLGNLFSRRAPSRLSSHHVHLMEIPSTQTSDRRLWKLSSSWISSFILVGALSSWNWRWPRIRFCDQCRRRPRCDSGRSGQCCRGRCWNGFAHVTYGGIP